MVSVDAVAMKMNMAVGKNVKGKFVTFHFRVVVRLWLTGEDRAVDLDPVDADNFGRLGVVPRRVRDDPDHAVIDRKSCDSPGTGPVRRKFPSVVTMA